MRLYSRSSMPPDALVKTWRSGVEFHTDTRLFLCGATVLQIWRFNLKSGVMQIIKSDFHTGSVKARVAKQLGADSLWWTPMGREERKEQYVMKKKEGKKESWVPPQMNWHVLWRLRRHGVWNGAFETVLLKRRFWKGAFETARSFLTMWLTVITVCWRVHRYPASFALFRTHDDWRVGFVVSFPRFSPVNHTQCATLKAPVGGSSPPKNHIFYKKVWMQCDSLYALQAFHVSKLNRRIHI